MADVIPASAWRRDLTILGVLMVVIYLMTASHGPLSSSTRYYEACREMVETGDWVVPQLAYVPYVEKPPLIYWLGAIARSFGDHPLITSLPSLLASLVTMVATYLFGCWWRGRVVGLGAAGLLIGSTFATVMSGVLTTDPLLAATTSVAFLLWWRWDLGERAQPRWLYGFYAAVAVGWLAKGPVALLLPAAAIATYALLRGGLPGIFHTLLAMRPWWGIAIITLVNLPWSIALMLRDPRMLEFFYVRINLDAFFQGNYNHPGPWWYYLPVLCGSLAPFTVLSLPLLGQSLWHCLRTVRLDRWGPRATATSEPTTLFLVSVAIGVLLFLSLSSAKLGTYLMPMMPALYLLLAEAINRWQGSPPRWAVWLVVVQAGVVLLVVALAPLFLMAIDESLEEGRALVILGATFAKGPDLQRIDWSYSGALLLGLALLLIGTLASAVAMAMKRSWTALGCLATGLLLLFAVILPRLDGLVPRGDLSSLARDLQANGWRSDDPRPPAERDVVLVNQSTVHDYEILLTLRQRLGIWGHARETGVGFFLQATRPDVPLPGPGQPISHPYHVCGDNTAHPWLWSTAHLVDDWQSQRRVWLITDEDLIKKLEQLGLMVHVISRTGHDVLLSNQP